MNKKLIFFVLIITAMLLSSCASPAAPVIQTLAASQDTQAASPPPFPSISTFSSQLSTLTHPQETENITHSDEEDTEVYNGDIRGLSSEEQELWGIIVDPTASGYGPLPVPKPQISDADKKEFNRDKISDYLISSLYDELDGYLYIKKASLKDGEFYLTVEYDIYADISSIYEYLRNSFSLPDKEIIKIFSSDNCCMHNGKMYTQLAWNYLNGTASDEEEEGIAISGLDPNYVGIGDIELPPMSVAENAMIVLYDMENDKAIQLTCDQFADWEVDGNVWFKYSDGEITGIAEEYCP
jgi:hypothetical protein